MKAILRFSLAALLLISCTDKHLDKKTFTRNDITVSWYRISRITTIHDYVDVERFGHVKNIMEANTDGIYDILIIKDTIVIQITPGLVIYKLAAKTLNCYIKIDTSITTYQYLKKYRPKGAEAFEEQVPSDTSVN